MQIGILNYGVGNVGSVFNAFWNLGEDAEIVSTPEKVLACDRLVLPGVGTPGPALAGLRKDGLDEALQQAVFDKGIPILGICLGMQLFADRLHEYGRHDGLAWIGGEVVDFADLLDGQREIVPHMGWAKIELTTDDATPLHGIGGNLYFYFAHSYVFRPTSDANLVAASMHGVTFAAALCKDNILATQFHPEKSQAKGEKFLEQFISWDP